MGTDVTILKSSDLPFARIELRSDGILTFEPDPGKLKDYTVPILEESLVAMLEISEGIPRPYFCDNRYVLGILGAEEKKFIKAHFHKFVSCYAMAENSPITRFVANSFFKAFKDEIDMRMFKDKESGITWLKKKSESG